MASVLVVDDQSLRRAGLRMLLAAEPDLTVVGDTASGTEAVRMSAALRPDVVLLGGHRPGTNGIDTIRRIAHPPRLAAIPGPGGPPPRILVLTSTGQEGDAYAALRAGAGGFLPKDATLRELTAAIRVVAAGDSVITPGLTRALIDTVRHEGAPRPGGRPVGPGTLTERERDVLVAVASGWSNAEIAARLSIAPTTVKSHVSHILAKIGARARVQAVAFAYEYGLVHPAA
ncbi:DNA-binding NarL/FixJ family response regulator [Streptomyces sp. 3330]|uniref:response regulator transcription factor n=1 Tax=Streptomyces sp. 3330 TaxID=2817755 RepID=UPI00285B58CB|nr:response regulator transcription factor [Streptomyces sp. 3330]MDR6975022.1 DNA-binding NarL/FixJ family response regulator [Streptomyces sp. 3330]